MRPRRTHLALSSDRYSVQAIPHVDWKGTRYWIGMSLKLTAWIRGQTFQLARRAAAVSGVDWGKDMVELSAMADSCVLGRVGTHASTSVDQLGSRHVRVSEGASPDGRTYVAEFLADLGRGLALHDAHGRYEQDELV